MTRKQYIGVALLVLGAVALFLRACRPSSAPSSHGGAPDNVRPLEPEEKLRVTVRPTHIVVQTPNKKPEVLTNVRRAEISFNASGQISVSSRKAGFVCEPAVSVLGSLDGFRIGLDTSLVYYRRLDFVVGVAVKPDMSLSPIAYMALAYTPSWKLSNTALFIAIGSNQLPNVGLRVKF